MSLTIQPKDKIWLQSLLDRLQRVDATEDYLVNAKKVAENFVKSTRTGFDAWNELDALLLDMDTLVQLQRLGPLKFCKQLRARQTQTEKEHATTRRKLQAAFGKNKDLKRQLQMLKRERVKADPTMIATRFKAVALLMQETVARTKKLEELVSRVKAAKEQKGALGRQQPCVSEHNHEQETIQLRVMDDQCVRLERWLADVEKGQGSMQGESTKGLSGRFYGGVRNTGYKHCDGLTAPLEDSLKTSDERLASANTL
ncbi:MAG: hypothetical protein BYD32DRAFT_312234 [Podila humilis]|nr:MAG: hypothetical protein BYD32DRAFT_312234 [Podila humilis]